MTKPSTSLVWQVDLDSMVPLPLDLVLKVFLDASRESSQGKGRSMKRVEKGKGDKKSKTGKETSRDKASSDGIQLQKDWKILKLRPCSSNTNLKSMISHTCSRTFFCDNVFMKFSYFLHILQERMIYCLGSYGPG